ncbi:MAG TPA: DNA-deoxyinosine glycosylase, partial [Firmicutes bacterium]|nr:DNA-deoxyinosine glycosylase [Bacillota bacterium]
NKAHELYDRYIKDSIGIEAIPLPSSSSANARFSVDDLIEKYSIIRELTENE